MNPPNPSSYKKATGLFGAILLTASVSGFFMGLRQTSSQISMTRPVSLVALDSERQTLLETNTIPHGTQLRSDCLSCHGPPGLVGLRTPHPDRQACVQCHAPNAELDEYHFYK